MRALAFSAVVAVGLVGLVLLYTPQQAQRGEKVFAQSCAVCHGEQGRGGVVPDRFGQLAGIRAPAVVGASTLDDFGDAGELLRYVSNQMPLDAPGSLTQEQYLAVTAWLLQQHGIEPDGKPLMPENASGIPLR